jgi:hypothetical protein
VKSDTDEDVERLELKDLESLSLSERLGLWSEDDMLEDQVPETGT